MKAVPFLLLAVLAAIPVFAQRGNPANVRGDSPAASPLSPEAQQAMFRIPPGFEVQLVAAEPDIGKPMNIAFDAAGRLWVTTTELYPFPARTDANGRTIAEFETDWRKAATRFRLGDSAPAPAEAGRDRVLVLSDFGPDGRARQVRRFADELNIPIGIQPLPRAPGSRGDAAIVFSIPAIWRLEDRDGDGFAESRRMLYRGFGFEDTHGMSSNYTYWLDGWIYGTHGHANHSEIHDASGHSTVMDGGSTYRFRADGSRFERWTHGQTNPFGTAFDPEGNLFTADSHSKPVYRLLRGGYYEGLAKKHDGLGFAPAITKDAHGSTGIAGIAYYGAEQFPAEYRENLFNGNPITKRINRAQLAWNGASPTATRLDDFLTCDDPSFRPVQVKLGPDGALWIADFYNPIIGHYETRLTHPARDRQRGRIWRVVWRGLDRTLPPPTLPDLSASGAAALLDAMATPNVVVRALAVNELVERLGPAALPGWQTRARAKLTAGAGMGRGEALGLLWALERLDAAPADAGLVAWAAGGGERVLAALQLLADRPQLQPGVEELARVVVERHPPGPLWLALAALWAEHPRGWQAPLVLHMITCAPAADAQLHYALSVALKHLITVGREEDLVAWAALEPGYAEILADVSLALPRPFVARFLLAQLERTGFAAARADEHVKHAATGMTAGQFDALCGIARGLDPAASRSNRLAVSEALALASRRLERPLPDDLAAWSLDIVLDALVQSDARLVERGLAASEGLSAPGIFDAWRSLVLDRRATASVRLAALQLMTADERGPAVAIEALSAQPDARLLDAAARILTSERADDAARHALVEALAAATPENGVVIAAALARNDRSAYRLIEAVESGRASAWLLLRAPVASALAWRDAALRGRVEAVTRALPSESVRLDRVIAERVAEFRPARAEPDNGAKVFTQHCAACHRFHDTGGSIGPGLDGMAVRGAMRLFEDILDPSRNIDPMFHRTTLKTRQGEEIVGWNLQTADSTVSLTDLAGNVVTHSASGIAATTTEAVSIMPPIFEHGILPDDLNDLVAYLMQKK